jgi:hypothetical protein
MSSSPLPNSLSSCSPGCGHSVIPHLGRPDQLGDGGRRRGALRAAILKVHVLATKPDVLRYQGRAAAETAKSLGWRYAVGGRPFRVGDTDATDRLFRKRLKEVMDPLYGLAALVL